MNDTNQTVDTSTRDARRWAMFCHLGALVGLLGNGVGFLIVPLVVWLIKKDEIPLVDDQGREALNFNISVMIAMIICVVAAFVLAFTGIFLIVGILAAGGVAVYSLVMTIIAGISAQKGELYRYPLTWRFF